MEKVFITGTMHDISGKRVEVKTATPRGSGPIGRGGGPAGMAQRLSAQAPPNLRGPFVDAKQLQLICLLDVAL